MFKRFHAACVMPVALLLSACASVTPQAYTPATAAPLKKVVIATQVQPPKVTAGIGGSMGLMFGGIGAGLAAAHAGEEGKTLDQLITGEGLNYQQRLQDSIVAAFKAAGVQATVVPVNRAGTDFVGDYKALLAANDADAVLDVVVLEASFGGTHPMFDPDPRPILRVRTQLVSAKTLQPLYAESISYGYSNPFISAKEIKAPKQYYFSNFAAIGTDKKRAAEGLGNAADEVARFITDQLVPANAKAAGMH
jgi:hypothetical protein